MKCTITGRILRTCILLAAPLWLTAQSPGTQYHILTKDELRDKIHAYWLGQLTGNFMGFPFENLYREEPIPILIDRYYTVRDLDSLDLMMNAADRRGHTHIMAGAMDGAWSDDDTDVEFVTLHAVEKYGLDLSYAEITEMWKKHINRFIWAANRQARDLMEEGLMPPETGSKARNPYWYRITSQLVNEIWSVFYPGMAGLAAERADWGAHIMCDDWATHATRAYAVMYSAAFFEKDAGKLVDKAIRALPEDSPYRAAMENVVAWHARNPDWRDTRRLIHTHYYNEFAGFKIPDPYLSAAVNGLSGIMAILYGQSDFLRTVSITVSAGYDCDNQAATCGGLLGIIGGTAGIPHHLLHEVQPGVVWREPFNNTYVNYSRDDLPNYNKISDLVDRMLNIAETAILRNGGKAEIRNGKTTFFIPAGL